MAPVCWKLKIKFKLIKGKDYKLFNLNGINNIITWIV